MDAGYLVFFARDPVDDTLADAILTRVRACPHAGWFDDPGGDSAAERTCGGYVRAAAVDEPHAVALLDAARELSGDHGVVVEVQWREEVVAHIERGVWRSDSAATDRA